MNNTSNWLYQQYLNNTALVGVGDGDLGCGKRWYMTRIRLSYASQNGIDAPINLRISSRAVKSSELPPPIRKFHGKQIKVPFRCDPLVLIILFPHLQPLPHCLVIVM